MATNAPRILLAANKVKSGIKSLLNPYRPVRSPIFLVATPRGGSTWLAELIWSQPGIRFVNEPFNLRREPVRDALNGARWRDFYSKDDCRRLEPYLGAIISGQNRTSDVLALKQWRRIGWRVRTDRVLLKIIHAGSDLLPWMCTRFGGRAVLLLRHPLATAVSRKVFPFLEEVRYSQLFNRLTVEQKKCFDETLRRNERFEKGVLAWCLFMAPALENASPDVLTVTYEQLVLDPEPALVALGQHLDLPDLPRLREALTTPSLSSHHCDEASMAALRTQDFSGRAQVLLSKWRRHVSDDAENRVMALLDVFHISAYKAGDLMPAPAFWLGDRS